jgi:uncharacterized protein (DUF2236 family)
MVGAGVRDHSSFRRQPLRRAWATADAALRLVFGNAGEARDAADQIYRFHDHVNGTLGEGAGSWTAGQRYTAHDATLLLWVWATLVDTGEVAFTRWVRPLTQDEAERYYADQITFARFFGIPDEIIPPDRDAFRAYLDDVLDSDLLASTAASRGLVRDVLWFSHRNVPAVLVRPLRALSVLTLDPRLRQRLGLELDARDAHLAALVDGVLVRHYRRLPRSRAGLAPTYIVLRRYIVGVVEVVKVSSRPARR